MRQRRRDVDDPGDALQHAALRDAGAGKNQRRPGLRRVQRTVLSEVSAAFRPVVGGGVHDDQIG